MIVTLPAQLLAKLDVPRAIEEELADPPQAYPSRIIEAALRPHVAEAAEYLTAQIRKGTDVGHAEELQVAKSQGLRPTLIMTLQERVLFRALTMIARDLLPTSEAEYVDFEDFKRRPITEDSPKYIVSADVAAFFQYVDHSVLADELLNHVPDYDLAATVTTLLGSLSRRQTGLPQSFKPSRVWAEAVIDRVERGLIRQGLKVWRYNDDFRIGAATLGEAQDALEKLEAGCRTVGLTLNDAKTFIEPQAEYEAYLLAPEAAWNALMVDSQVDLSDVDAVIRELYDAIAILPAEQEDGTSDATDNDVLAIGPEWVTGAEKALSQWRNGLQGPSDRLHERVRRRLVVEAIKVIRAAKSPNGITYVPLLILKEPHLTPQVASYLRSIYRAHRHLVRSTLEVMISSTDHYLSPWKSAWLLEPLFLDFQLTPALETWVRSLVAPHIPDIVRVRAAHLLARAGILGPSALAALYEEVREAARPDLVAALANAAVEVDMIRRSLHDNRINEWIAEAHGTANA